MDENADTLSILKKNYAQNPQPTKPLPPQKPQTQQDPKTLARQKALKSNISLLVIWKSEIGNLLFQ